MDGSAQRPTPTPELGDKRHAAEGEDLVVEAKLFVYQCSCAGLGSDSNYCGRAWFGPGTKLGN